MTNDLEKLISSAMVIIQANGGIRVNGKVASLRTREYTEQAIKESCRRLHRLGFYLASVEGLQAKHIEALVRDWHRQGLSNKTMQNQFSRLRIFCGWLGRSGLIKDGGVPAYLPEVAPSELKVSTIAAKSKSWTENGIDIAAKIKAAKLEDLRHGHMLLLGVAFGLRKKEMLRIKLWRADKGHCLDIDGSVAKNGRFRSIPLEEGPFGVAQRWVLDEAKKVCGKYEPMGWPGLTIKQAENRYYHRMKRLGITRFDAGVTGHGLRAEYAENLLLLRGLMPPTLGGAIDQMSKVDRDPIIIDSQRKLGHNIPDKAAAYFGTFRNQRHVDGIGGRIGSVILVDSDNDIFAMVYANPAPIQLADKTYKIKTTEERNNTAVTVVVEQQGAENKNFSLVEFVENWPALSEKVRRQLVLVGLGE